MGISKELFHELRTMFWSRVFHAHGPQKEDTGPWVHIYDCMRHHDVPPGSYTGKQYTKTFFGQHIERVTREKEVQLVIYVGDRTEDVTPLKKRTQNKRDSSSEILPYPTEGKIAFGDEGICIDGEWELIDAERMARSRHLRDLLFEYMKVELSQSMETFGTAVILDFGTTAPFLLARGRNVILPNHLHRKGEADIGVIYWLSVFRRFNVVVESIDTDQFLIGLLALANDGSLFEKHYWWKFGNHRTKVPNGHVDMIAAYHTIRKDTTKVREYTPMSPDYVAALPWPIAALALCFLLCESDIVGTDLEVTYGIGPKNIFLNYAEFVSCNKPATVERMTREAIGSPDGLEKLLAFLQHKHGSQAWVKSKDRSAWIRDPVSKKVFKPKDKEFRPLLEDFHARLFANFQYWMRDFSKSGVWEGDDLLKIDSVTVVSVEQDQHDAYWGAPLGLRPTPLLPRLDSPGERGFNAVDPIPIECSCGHKGENLFNHSFTCAKMQFLMEAGP